MKNKLNLIPLGILVALATAQTCLAAKELKSGSFAVVKSKVEHTQGTTKSMAKEKETVDEKSVVDTGPASFTQLDFSDASVLRLGANTQFSFQSKERIIKLESGSMIMNVPPGNGGVMIDGGGVTGAVSGTTIMANKDAQGNFSFMVLEGSPGKVTARDGSITQIQPGQMATLDVAGGAPKVIAVNMDSLRDISPLFSEFESAMPGNEKIQAVADLQAEDIQTDLGSLQGPAGAGLTGTSPSLLALSALTGLSVNAILGSNNMFVGDASTAAGAESGSGQNSTPLYVNEQSAPNDSRQASAKTMVASSLPPSSSGADVNTAAGGGADAAGTDTAAGGNSAPDTQQPRTLAQPSTTPTPGLATPL
ncbi:MAG: FecR domain-containing protein [Aliarcobacter sp.]